MVADQMKILDNKIMKNEAQYEKWLKYLHFLLTTLPNMNV